MRSLEKLKANSVWYDANLDSLLPKCRGRHVAIAEVDWESAGGHWRKDTYDEKIFFGTDGIGHLCRRGGFRPGGV